MIVDLVPSLTSSIYLFTSSVVFGIVKLTIKFSKVLILTA
jgi:hypothetical protein